MSEVSPSTVRIGGASGFWGDSAIATPQLLAVPGLRYLVYDYLAETTMAILARAQMKTPTAGYATDFVQAAMAPHLTEILGKGIRVVANAGGLNPEGCRDALLEAAKTQGLAPKIAIVTGDGILADFARLCADGTLERPSRTLTGLKPLSANLYIGAAGVAQALATGADIVITGRTVDSACVLGILVHEFGWSWSDFDRLAAGTLAGHVVECGAQATGGLYTDWARVPDWANIGYPVIDCAADGSFVVSKPDGTGGLIEPGAVAEQILYEVGDPANYLMPDVTCDLTHVTVEALDDARVKVSGVAGRRPGPLLKGNATYREGYQIQLMLAIRGMDAARKAEKTADTLLARTRAQLRAANLPDYSETRVELLGCNSHYPEEMRDTGTREIMLRIAARHELREGLAFLQREAASPGTSMGPGTRSSFFGRMEIQPVVKVMSFFVPKRATRIVVTGPDGTRTIVPEPLPAVADLPAPPAPPVAGADAGPDGPTVARPLVALALARSGDKGDDANIGVIARDARYVPLLRRELTAERVRALFAHLVAGGVERFEVPGLNAFNFLMHEALGGGGVCSLRSDPLGKSLAQILLELPVEVPAAWAEALEHGDMPAT